MKNLIFGYKIPTRRDLLRVQNRLSDHDIEIFAKINEKHNWLFIDHDAHQDNEFVIKASKIENNLSKFYDIYFLQINSIITKVLNLDVIYKVIIGNFSNLNGFSHISTLPLNLKYNSSVIVEKVLDNKFRIVKCVYFWPKKEQYDLNEIYQSLLTFEKE